MHSARPVAPAAKSRSTLFRLLLWTTVSLSAFSLPTSRARDAAAANYVAGDLIQLNDNGAWSWFMDPRVIVDKGKLIVGSVRAMESYAREVGGYQCLYADTFMTRDEFEQMFDHRFYRPMRAKYGAESAFPEVWQKVKLQW